MNWLAHLYLSEPDPGTRLGNLVADLVKGSARQRLSPALRRGIVHHQKIDAFTDHHPFFHQSKRRIPAAFDRFAGILVDIFYDHLLARSWPRYSAVSLEAFADDVYRSFDAYLHEFPAETCGILERMALQNWLVAYRAEDGLADVLRRLSLRIAQRIDWNPHLEQALPALVADRQAFATDFEAFFPELCRACGPASVLLDGASPAVRVGAALPAPAQP